MRSEQNVQQVRTDTNARNSVNIQRVKTFVVELRNFKVRYNKHYIKVWSFFSIFSTDQPPIFTGYPFSLYLDYCMRSVSRFQPHLLRMSLSKNLRSVYNFKM